MSHYAYSKTLLCWIFIFGFSLTSFAQQGPILDSPPWGVSLGNGTKDLQIGISWSFSWYPVHYAQEYQIEIENLYGGGKFIANTTTTSFNYIRRTGYIESQALGGWFWKVRAQVNGVWGPWSELRYFNVIPAAEKALPLDYYGDGFYRIQAAYYHYFLAIAYKWYVDWTDIILDIERPENTQVLFQFEGTSHTEELYHIKVYKLLPGGSPEFIGYLQHNLEITQGQERWNIIFTQNAHQFQIPGTNTVIQITYHKQGVRVEKTQNNYTQGQIFKLIPY